jgi:hypothetical protein
VDRKKITVLIAALSLCAMRPCYGAPAYGTKMPKKNQLFIGGQTHWIFERDLEDGHGEVSSLQHFLLLSYGLMDWLCVDLKGGAGDIDQQPGSGNEIHYPAFMAGGYGFRLRFYEQKKAKAVFGFQHISVHPYTPHIGATKHKAVLDDWQFSFLGSYEVKGVTPYLGAKWSRMDYIHWVEDTRKRKKSDLGKSVGIIAGLDIPLTERAWINIEAQFVDVQAMAISLNFHF